MGGLHVTSLSEEASAHADTIFLRPGEDTWPQFLSDFRRGCPERLYQSHTRTLAEVPPIRRDLIQRRLYLVPNSIVVSRGCPHVCDFSYKEAFFEGGRSFYTQTVDAALAEIECLPGRHLYFLDDHLFGDPRFATALFEGMRALSTANLLEQRKFQNLRRDYSAAIRRLHDLGVMVNGSFVFGMDADDASVFDRTVEWAIEQGSRRQRSTSSPRTRAPRCTAGSTRNAASRRRTGICTIRVTRCSGPRACPWRSSSRDTGARTATFIAGDRSPAAQQRTATSFSDCGISRTRPGGRSSNRCGTSSSARSARA